MYAATGWLLGSNPSGKREAEQLQKMQIEYHVLVQDIRFFRHHPKTVKKLVCQNLLTLVTFIWRKKDTVMRRFRSKSFGVDWYLSVHAHVEAFVARAIGDCKI